MKTITLKTDDHFFEKVTSLAKHLHLSKSELIRRSVSEFEKLIEREEMRQQMKQASMRVRQSHAKISHEFENTLNDGLENV